MEALLEHNLCIGALSMNANGKRKGGASSQKLNREVKALLSDWEREAMIAKMHREQGSESSPC